MALRARFQGLRDQEAYADIQGGALLQAQSSSSGRALGWWQAAQRGPAVRKSEDDFCPRALGGVRDGKQIAGSGCTGF